MKLNDSLQCCKLQSSLWRSRKPTQMIETRVWNISDCSSSSFLKILQISKSTYNSPRHSRRIRLFLSRSYSFRSRLIIACILYKLCGHDFIKRRRPWNKWRIIKILTELNLSTHQVDPKLEIYIINQNKLLTGKNYKFKKSQDQKTNVSNT